MTCVPTRSWHGRALLFDLFGTLVHFRPRVPTVEAAGVPWRSAMHWLQEAAVRELPDVRFDDLLTALMRVTEEVIRQRPPEYREVPSRERFRRALLQLDIDAQQAPALAERLSLVHMSHLASMTVLPPAHPRVLQQLAARYRLGLVSNFDHAPTARRILDDHGLTGFFEAIIISEDFGQRKPHPAIFEAALRTLEAAAEHALFIGDSLSDDVTGAQNAGLAVAWINAKHDPLPPGARAPDYVVAELSDLLTLLE
ncbi:MAG: HAD family hydrolase [Candidatus Binatia bacterium]